MRISELEARFAAQPESPMFVRLASQFLGEGRYQEAANLCVEGVKRFPAYRTANLILGKCFEGLGRDVEALLEYRRVLKALPDNVMVQNLVDVVEKREQESFELFAAARLQAFKDRKDTQTIEAYIGGKPEVQEGPQTSVMRRREESAVTADGDQDDAAPREGGGKIVTVTLAEIYASQGEYSAAIDAYRRLSQQRPAEARRYERRIGELEMFARKQEETKE